MITITAIEKYKKQTSDEIFTFLAGGITNCKEWQDAILKSQLNTMLMLLKMLFMFLKGENNE